MVFKKSYYFIALCCILVLNILNIHRTNSKNVKLIKLDNNLVPIKHVVILKL